MTLEIAGKVRDLKPGEYITVAPSIRAFRKRDNSGVTFSVKSNRPGMPRGAQQVTFDTFEEAAELTRKIGVTQRVAAYSHTHSQVMSPKLLDDTTDAAKYYAGFAPVPCADDADADEDANAAQTVKIIDPLLNTLDDIHEAISDAAVDCKPEKINALNISYSRVCDLLRSNVIGSSVTS